MPVWLAILLAVGVPLMTAAVSTPLVLHVLARPRVKFVHAPAAFWAYSEDGATLSVVIDLTLINEGNEETNISAVGLDLIGGQNKEFQPSLTPEINNWKLERNGGRLDKLAIFQMPNPGKYKFAPHADAIPYFIEYTAQGGTLFVYPPTQTPLLVG